MQGSDSEGDRRGPRSPRSPVGTTSSPRTDAPTATATAVMPAATTRSATAWTSPSSKLPEQMISTDVPNTIKLLSELERSWAMFTAHWKVIDLFAGMQIWQEHANDSSSSSLEQLNFVFWATVSTGFITFIAATIGGGGIPIAVILSALVVCGTMLTVSAVRAKGEFPCYKVVKPIDGAPSEIFLHIMNIKNYPIWDASIEKAEVIHTIDDHSDIIHVVYRPVWMWPIWLTPRDLCLLRYWRRTEEGSYMICLQSTVHPECPPTHEAIRAKCNGGGFIIAPRAQASTQPEEISSLVTHVVHMDPLGWESRILRRLAITYTYVRPQVLALSGLQEVMEARKYVCPNLAEEFAVAAASAEEMSGVHGGMGPGEQGANGAAYGSGSVVQLKEFPTNVPREMWSEPDPGMMLVRGPDYLTDRRKVPSAPPAFRLMGADLYRCDGPVYNIASHPGCSLQKQLSRHETEGTEMPFTFVMNFVVPGGLHLVLYYQAPDPGAFKDGSPFAELFHDFLEGTNEYRSEHFKLIPCIFEGSFIVRQAVGTTPVIIGKKLSQPYFRGKQYFELDVDIGSSAVANRVVGLVLGYTKKIVVDMGFLIEGQCPEELPERLFGSVRLVHIDLGVAKKLE